MVTRGTGENQVLQLSKAPTVSISWKNQILLFLISILGLGIPQSSLSTFQDLCTTLLLIPGLPGNC